MAAAAVELLPSIGKKKEREREKGAPIEVLNDSLDGIHLLLTHQLFCNVHDEEPTFPAAAAAEKGLQANNELFLG